MTPFAAALADELTKIAKPTGAVRRFLDRLQSSPELRSAIRRSTVLGAATGGLTGALSKKEEDESRLKKVLGGAAIGAAGGAATGAAFPGWFHRHQMLAHDEQPGSKLQQHIGTVNTLASLGNLATKAIG